MALPQSLLDATACYRCLGISLGDALMLALWEEISDGINPSPPAETFFRISNLGDVRISAVGDSRTYQ